MTAVKTDCRKYWQWLLPIVLLVFLMTPALAAAEEGNDTDPGEVADVVDDDKDTYDDDDKDAYDDDKDAYDDNDDMDDEGPAFQNPAQAQKAENLAHEATRNTRRKILPALTKMRPKAISILLNDIVLFERSFLSIAATFSAYRHAQ